MGDGRALRHPMSEHARAGLGRLPHYTLGSGSTQIPSSPRWDYFTSVPCSSGQWFSSVHIISLHFVQFRPVHFSTVQVWSVVQFSSLHVVHFGSLRHSSVQYRSFQVGGSVQYSSPRYFLYSSVHYITVQLSIVHLVTFCTVHFSTVLVTFRTIQFNSSRHSSVQ